MRTIKVNQKNQVNQALRAFDEGNKEFYGYYVMAETLEKVIKLAPYEKTSRLTSAAGQAVMNAILLHLNDKYSGQQVQFVNSHGNVVSYSAPTDSIRREIQKWITSKKKAAQSESAASLLENAPASPFGKLVVKS